MEYSNYYAPRKRKSKSKHKNISVKIDGITFDSIQESKYYRYLKNQKEIGNVIEFETQVPFLVLDGKKYKITYKSDFVATYKDGTKKVIDVKGSEKTLTTIFKMKAKMFYEKYGFEIICVKQVNKRWVEF